MQPFDIAPYALPAAPAGEFWFEEPRDIRQLQIRFGDEPPARLQVFYWRRNWPQVRLDGREDRHNPGGFGWTRTDDWSNGAWQRARIVQQVGARTVRVRFRRLSSERLAGAPADYRPTFRRTMGLRLQVPASARMRGVQIHTCSAPAESVLRVELHAGRRTPAGRLWLAGYNAVVRDWPGQAAGHWELEANGPRTFLVRVRHMEPAHPYAGDDGLVEFHWEEDAFTISLAALAAQGPIWYAERGVYVARADDARTFADYRRQHASARTVREWIASGAEHTLAAAMNGQPRPHPAACSFGCKHSPQRFWLEPNGDLLLHRRNLTGLDQPGASAARFRNAGNARFFFGLERWLPVGRGPQDQAVPIYHLCVRRDGLRLEQAALCVPLTGTLAGELAHDDVTVALLRFRVTNLGAEPAQLALPILYSEDSRRQRHGVCPAADQTDELLPRSPLVPLAVRGDTLCSRHGGELVVRAVLAGQVQVSAGAAGAAASMASGGAAVHAGEPSYRTGPLAAWVRAWLTPGSTCEFVLKVPYVALYGDDELQALRRLEFAAAAAQVAAFWRREAACGAQLRAPVPQLEALHANHLMHVQITDFVMPGCAALLNTSVGSSTYGNFSNEACMIVQELDQRGLGADAQRRLDLWVRYQGTKPQPGNFTDCEGMFFGAGGFEQGHYNQHHGWVLWALAEHYLLTGDRAWFAAVAPAVLAGAEWVFRQRRQTLGPLPRSRGWERGFLPAGSLEDVTEFYYWLSTNCLTWRGADAAARALAAYGHPEAARLQAEADAYGRDLRTGLETMRQHAPLVRLRDGRWVPHYPSRLYCRGRDVGWIREVLEGAVYLLLSGLYASSSRQAEWILDDYLDNLYHQPPFGYANRDPENTLRARGGFSMQPCLLAGLLPHLERDEPEVFLWMLFNAFAAVYREEIGGMIEHPLPELGFDNAVSFKTSDEANAVMWLRYAYVYWTADLLHFGRALPRAWFLQERPFGLTGVHTHHGATGVRYEPCPQGRGIAAEVDLRCLRAVPPQVLVRFRAPQRAPLRRVRIDGAPALLPAGEDVKLTGKPGVVRVEVEY